MPLEVIDVTVGYFRDVYILNEVSIEAKGGQITCIIGPNGAGKSTLLKTIYGFLKPHKGEVRLDGRDITGLMPFQTLGVGIAYITQDGGILSDMDAEENLELGAWLFKKEKQRVKGKIAEIYDRYPVLKKRRGVKARFLSGGEQRMLEFGKALMNDPQVILFDEPVAGLAPLVAKEIYDEIEKLRDEGRTIVLVEQNVKKALSISDYAYVLELGRIEYEGTEDQMELKKIVAPWLRK
ncbi:MAG: ATP-binding cassette domain-containing protein [Proteobacteria bacterium]|nr:ATP-binding cassette domain-containing protein [Pseudomonadota bacterium]